jgi:hypothetical protein
LEAIVDDRGIEVIPNIDVDGDDISDELRWSCPKSGSLIPTDPCTMWIKLSSSGRVIAFENLRFYLFRYQKHIWIVAASQGDMSKSDIYQLSRAGLKHVCSNL